MSHQRGAISPAKDSAALMRDFLSRSSDPQTPTAQRYLWTDAFAVCNLLGLARLTGDTSYTRRALQLIDDVHRTLGQFRADDTREGWLSGLSGAEAEAHPTAGGLRIGKSRPERGVEEPFDERAEWEREGQYFHYLSKWMHALDQAAHATSETRFNRWARELAQRAFEAFVYRPSEGAAPRMFWKMSTDLSRPQVPAMGQHDPLDAYITYVQLQASAERLGDAKTGPSLEQPIAVFEGMANEGNWASADPLGIGGLLGDAYRVAQLRNRGRALSTELLSAVLEAAEWGLQQYQRGNEIQFPAEYRLAFRELGLAIGLQACQRHFNMRNEPSVEERLRRLHSYQSLGDAIAAFWRNPAHQNVATWHEHQDINQVMLATALSPDGFLELQ